MDEVVRFDTLETYNIKWLMNFIYMYDVDEIHHVTCITK